jgi:hypothetical protein
MSTNLFISWSGKLSQAVAAAIHEWIPSVIQSVDPFLSSEDIDKGARWSDNVASKLEECGFGIIVLTSSNLSAPWIMFESGALSKMVGGSNVAPVLVNVEIAQVRPPLSQFQATRLQEEDFLKLIRSINKAGDAQIKDDVVEKTFRAMWPHSAIEANAGEESDSDSKEVVDIGALGLSVGDLIKTVQGLRDEIRGDESTDIRAMFSQMMFEIGRMKRSTSRVAPGAVEDLEFIYSALRDSLSTAKSGRISLSKAVSEEVLEKAERVLRHIRNRTMESERLTAAKFVAS